MGEPAIHFALNCASLSCPDLLNEPFWPDERLKKQFHQQTLFFLQNQAKGLKKTSDNRLKLSKIFDWYRADFAPTGGVMSYLRQFDPTLPTQADIGYIPYNWALNALPQR
jgi:hypothetical protein